MRNAAIVGQDISGDADIVPDTLTYPNPNRTMTSFSRISRLRRNIFGLHGIQRFGSKAVCGIVLFMIAPYHTTRANAAESGSIQGRVFNADSGSFLNNARVSALGTQLETFTDETGAYRFNGVPAGSVTLRVFYTGLNPGEEAVIVHGGETVLRDFRLTAHNDSRDGAVQLENYVVTADKQMGASAIAINEQRFAGNLKTVMASDAFGDSVDGNVGEFIKNMPGVSVDYDGAEVSNVSVRGFSSAYTPVTIDGDRMASATPSQTRAVSLNNVALVNVARIEVVKGPTPDISATSLGGSVNLVSKSAFELAKPQFTYRVLSNFNSEYATFSKSPQPAREPTRKIKPGADISYTAPLTKNFGFTVNALYSDQFYPQHSIRPEWNPKSPGTLENPYFNKFQFQESPKTSERVSVGGKIDWRITPEDAITVGAQYNRSDKMSSTHNMQFSNGSLLPLSPSGTTPVVYDYGPTHVHGAVGKGTLDYGGSNQRTTGYTYNVNLGHVHRGEVWTIEDRVYYSYSRSQGHDIDQGNFETVNMRLKGVTVNMDEITELRPGSFTVIDESGATVDPFTIAGKTLLQTNSKQKRAIDSFGGWKLNARRNLDLAVPIMVKAGAAIDRQDRDIFGPSTRRDFVGPDGKASTADDDAGLYGIADSNAVPPGWGLGAVEWPSNYNTYDLFLAHPDYFYMDEARLASSTVQESYKLAETIYAGYVMADAKFWQSKLRVIGGVRYERTHDRSLGGLTDPSLAYERDAQGQVILDEDGEPLLKPEVLPEADPTGGVLARLTMVPRGSRASRVYNGWYPSVHVTYSLSENLLARASYAKTLGRPELNRILPNVSVSETKEVITANNAGLRPWEADNFDVALEYYLSRVGLLSVGVFRKDLHNYFGKVDSAVTAEELERYALGEEYSNYTLSTLTNVGTVRVTGFEFSYQQSLAFLPEWGKGISVYLNGTLLDIEGEDTADMRGFIPRTFNWGVSHDTKRTNLQLRWNYRGRQRNSKLDWPYDPPGFEYILPRLTLDVNAELRLSRHSTLFANVRNIADVAVDTERTAPGYPAYARLYRSEVYGAQYGLGVKVTY